MAWLAAYFGLFMNRFRRIGHVVTVFLIETTASTIAIYNQEPSPHGWISRARVSHQISDILDRSRSNRVAIDSHIAGFMHVELANGVLGGNRIMIDSP